MKNNYDDKEKLEQIAKELLEIVKEVVQKIMELLKPICDKIKECLSKGYFKFIYLACRGKTKRIRKKYFKRLLEIT